jgi:hypothetical protein
MSSYMPMSLVTRPAESGASSEVGRATGPSVPGLRPQHGRPFLLALRAGGGAEPLHSEPGGGADSRREGAAGVADGLLRLSQNSNFPRVVGA